MDVNTFLKSKRYVVAEEKVSTEEEKLNAVKEFVRSKLSDAITNNKPGDLGRVFNQLDAKLLPKAVVDHLAKYQDVLKQVKSDMEVRCGSTTWAGMEDPIPLSENYENSINPASQPLIHWDVALDKIVKGLPIKR